MSNTRKARSSKICLDLRSATAPLWGGFSFGGTDLEKNHFEQHYVARVGWLRAAVLGANDGIVSTASLIVGVAAASGRAEVLVAGIAGLAAGGLSMAAGGYVSGRSQGGTGRGDVCRGEGRDQRRSRRRIARAGGDL